MSSPLFNTASLIFAICFATLTVAQDWPQWRGPNRTGEAIGAKLPKVWPENAPTPLWKAHIGTGYSGPAIQDGRVFILGRDEEKGREICYGLHAATGKELWRRDYPEGYKPPDVTGGLGPKSTPTIDRGQVYMLGLGGMLHAFDCQTGRVIWKHDCRKEFWGVEKDATGDDAWFPSCGSAASPLIDGDRVILPLGGKKAGSFTALDRATGRILWRSLEERGSYSSPMLATLCGVRQIVGFTGLRMVGITADGKDLLWEFPFPAQYEQTVLTPIIYGDKVILGGEKRPTIALRIEKQTDDWQVTEAWKNADLRGYLSTPVVVGEQLIGFDNRLGRLVCIALENGETAWTSPKIGGYASLVVAGDRVLALNSDGELIVVDAAAKEFSEVARWKVSEAGATWSHLAVVGNRLYVKDKEHLMCLEVK